jgi:C-terminal processing protease CtpA/Prc
MRPLFLLILLGASVLIARAAPSTAPVDVDTLSQDDVSKAISAIKDNYVRKNSLTDAELQRATLQGLLDRLASAVALTSTESTPPPAPFYSELYNTKTGYLRIGALSQPNLDQAKQTLSSWTAQGVKSVILDLRGTPPTDDFTKSSIMLAGFFRPVGAQLFGLESEPTAPPPTVSSSDSKLSVAVVNYVVQNWPAPTSPPVFTGILVVIVDADTAQAPEAVAAFLQKWDKALIVGDRTAGQPYKYRDIPLGGATLRVAVAQAILPDGKGQSGIKIGDQGVTPDIAISLGAASKSQVLSAVTAHGIASATSEHDRPHLSEAALVSGSDPEVDELEAEQSSQKPSQPLIDRQLQRALDLVTSISIYSARLPSTASPGN